MQSPRTTTPPSEPRSPLLATQDPALVLSGTAITWRNGVGHIVQGTVETARHRLGGYQLCVRDRHHIRHHLDMTAQELRAALVDKDRARRLIDGTTPADPLAARVVAERIVRGGGPGIDPAAALRLLAAAYLDTADSMGLARPRLPAGRVA